MDSLSEVLLLAIYKKEPDEDLKDVLLMLEGVNLFNLKEGKRLLKELRNKGYVTNDGLSLKGAVLAKRIEDKFKIR